LEATDCQARGCEERGRKKEPLEAGDRRKEEEGGRKKEPEEVFLQI